MRVKTEERRQTILQIAKEVFRESGYEGASMSQIVQRLGGSKATLYAYFPSKEELFKAVMLELAFEAAGSFLDSPYESIRTADDFVLHMRELGVRYLKVIMAPEPTAGYRLAITEGARSDLGRDFYERGPKRMLEYMARAMRHGIDCGILRQDDAMRMAMHLRALYQSEISEARLLGVLERLSDAEVNATIEHAVRIFMRAYALEPGTS